MSSSSFLFHTAGGQDGTTTELKPKFAILTANDNEHDAVKSFLAGNGLSAADIPDREASAYCYKVDAFLQNKNASISMNKQTLSYSTFTIDIDGKRVAGVHVHCDRYSQWGAFDKTVQLLTDAKSDGWSLKTIFVVGCCGASMTKEKKEEKIWCGTVLLANEVKGYLHAGKVEEAEGVDGRESQLKFLGKPVTFEMDLKWLQPLNTVAKTKYDTGFRKIDVRQTMYLSGPLVIKNKLFGDGCRGEQNIAGVEMEVIGVIKAVKAIHQYSKDECPDIVLAKGISDCTSDKAKKIKCMFFGKEKEVCGDKERQMYATLQSIALVIRCVANNIQEFC